MNKEQEKRYNKAFTDEFYLLNRNVNGNIIIFNISGSTSNVYKVSINTKSIQCNCPDSAKWAKARGVICKHCCFVLHKVLGVVTKVSTYFNRYIFTPQEYKVILEKSKKLDIRKNDLVNLAYSAKYNALLRSGLKKTKSYDRTKEVTEDDMCGICYDEFLDKCQDFQCPVCNNITHKDCLNRWIKSGKKECIYCRQDILIFVKSSNGEEYRYMNLYS